MSLLRRWKLERRTTMTVGARHRIGAVAFGVVAAFGLGAVVSGANIEFIGNLWTSSFGTPRGINDMATLSVPLILTGLAASIPLRLGLWNIGGEGQLFIGAWAAAAIAFLIPGLGWPLLIPMMIVASMLGGALWIVLPALARVHFNVNEIITTLLLNFVAVFWVLYWAGKPWRDPLSVGGVKSQPIPSQGEVPLVPFGSVELPVGFLLAVAIAIVVWLVMRQTTVGYELGILGASPSSARFAGIPARRLLVYVLLAGGAIAGLAGALEMMGNTHRFGGGLSNNTGYTGIVIAVLAGASALGVVALSIIFALIAIVGGIFRATGTSADIVFAMYGVILIFGAMGESLARFKLVRRPTAATAGDAEEAVQAADGATGSREQPPSTSQEPAWGPPRNRGIR